MGKIFLRLGGWTIRQIWERYQGPNQNIQNVQAIVKEHAISKEENIYVFPDGLATIKEDGQTSISLSKE